MPDLLLELFSEEIPARMQGKAADDLKKLVTDGMVAAGLTYEGAKAFVTPRRITLHVAGIPARSMDKTIERKGPRYNSAAPAVHGFLKSLGIPPNGFRYYDTLREGESAPFENITVKVSGSGKDATFFALVKTQGRSAVEILADLIPGVVRGFPWPKSMRWGPASTSSTSLRWVRPLQSILCTFGPETEEPEIVPFEIDGIQSGNVTYGHRFLAPQAITVRRFDDYVAKLEKAKVVLDAERRRDIILADAKTLAMAQGLELVEDEGLLAEVAGLVEWPVVLMGSFEEEFLDIPGEVVRATIRINQKCFVLKRGDKLANKFLLTSNLEATDGGSAIIAGNERVVRARLSDAKFFWDTDRKATLESRMGKFENIVFHEKIGTQAARIDRIVALAGEIAPLVGADVKNAQRAAKLAKADLLTEVVGEFPEVQGLMGKYYATLEGEDASVAAACEEHYKPQGPSDRVPTDPVSIAVALADKLDTLTAFWAIDEKPTGSKDPYALRRAALGVIRLVVENGVRMKIPAQLLDFFHDRLKVQLRDSGARHDLVDAVLANGAGNDDLLLIVKRVEALGRFVSTDEGKNLIAGTKRAANILKAEEKKDGKQYRGEIDLALLEASGAPEEKALAHVLDAASRHAHDHLLTEDYEGAMAALAEIRPAVDAFFDKILVNDPDAAIRANRLALLARIREATAQVADFDRIAG